MVGIGDNNFPENLSVLDGKNWEKWGIHMRVIFNVQDMFKYVAEGHHTRNPRRQIKRSYFTFNNALKQRCLIK